MSAWNIYRAQLNPSEARRCNCAAKWRWWPLKYIFLRRFARLSKTSDPRHVVYQHKMEPKYVYTWLEMFSIDTDRLNQSNGYLSRKQQKVRVVFGYLGGWMGYPAWFSLTAWVSIFAANSKSSLPFHDGLLCAVMRNGNGCYNWFWQIPRWTESLYYNRRYHNSGYRAGEERTNFISNISV